MDSLPTRDVEVVLLTGASGAGRSTAAHVMEDLGYYVVDNLPPSMIPEALRLASAESAIERIAIVTDVRSRAFPGGLPGVVGIIKSLEDAGIRPTVVFLDCSDDVLVRRFENVRRAHPLQGNGTILEGIEAEKAMLRSVRGTAHLLIDTSDLSVHDLRRVLEDAFDGQVGRDLRMTVMSFGFKYGLPRDADLVFDARYLPNPHWDPRLRPFTGRDAPVSDFVLSQDGASEALGHLRDLVRTVLPGYRREGKRYMTIAIGCTGGKHRSVAMAEALADRLRGPGIDLRVLHRDLGKE
ncbi:RNase adapter RapZ [Cumulibacter manganitolerans]|uniref:RNase adapter RapZ n=1 Tax=Cumulibacter manganitolerans TaxID=1884992 RepID=UPI001295B5C2|nr:RNase adapter RapZ [Cumulibacter manganitolerans]